MQVMALDVSFLMAGASRMGTLSIKAVLPPTGLPLSKWFSMELAETVKRTLRDTRVALAGSEDSNTEPSIIT